MNCELWIVNCELWIVNCELWIVNCELWIVNCELWIVNSFSTGSEEGCEEVGFGEQGALLPPPLEDRQKGHVRWNIYTTYFAAIGPLLGILTIISLLLMQVLCPSFGNFGTFFMQVLRNSSETWNFWILLKSMARSLVQLNPKPLNLNPKLLKPINPKLLKLKPLSQRINPKFLKVNPKPLQRSKCLVRREDYGTRKMAGIKIWQPHLEFLIPSRNYG